jgi:hypothetical protein
LLRHFFPDKIWMRLDNGVQDAALRPSHGLWLQDAPGPLAAAFHAVRTETGFDAPACCV